MSAYKILRARHCAGSVVILACGRDQPLAEGPGLEVLPGAAVVAQLRVQVHPVRGDLASDLLLLQKSSSLMDQSLKQEK